MPRSLVIGNRKCLFAYDDRYRIRDLFFPYVGQYNNLGPLGVRLGFYADGALSWLHDDSWSVSCTASATGSSQLVGEWLLENQALNLCVVATDFMATEGSVLHRQLRIRNTRGDCREVKLFSTQQTHIRETDIGDTALFDPSSSSMIHYKGNIYLAFGAPDITQYAAGISGFAGLDGTYRDAEDGVLSNVPIAQGSVDSTFGLDILLQPGEEIEVCLFVSCCSDHRIAAPPALAPPSDTKTDLYSISLAVIAAHFDQQGALVAAIDSDIMATNRANYAYCWMRDGALTSIAMTDAGRPDLARDFLRFCNGLCEDIPFYQKYLPDGSRGASWHPWIKDGVPVRALQEDETALPLVALRHYLEKTSDLVFVRKVYEGFGRRSADFLVYHRDAATGLPLPSFDLWEERLGVHTCTIGTVIAGLEAAATIEDSLGNDSGYQEVADQMKAALLEHCVLEKRFLRGLDDRGNVDILADASLLLLPLLGVVPADHPIMLETARFVQSELWCSYEGGLARYPGDYYFRTKSDSPGNPWIICTLWLAQYKLLLGLTQEAEQLLVWVECLAKGGKMLAEQYDPETLTPLSVSPLVWSHAEYVATRNMLTLSRQT